MDVAGSGDRNVVLVIVGDKHHVGQVDHAAGVETEAAVHNPDSGQDQTGRILRDRDIARRHGVGR